MRLRFTNRHEGETSGVQGRWRRQSGRRAAAGGATSSDSGSMGPYTENPVITPPPTETPSTDSFTIKVAGIKFSGAEDAYNPLFDRARKLRIDPPQWRKENLLEKILGRDEPISYVQGRSATVKLDITGLPEIPKVPKGRSIFVRVTPSAKLRKQRLVKKQGKLVVEEDPGASSYPITFDPPDRTIKVSDWGADDYDQLEFTTSAFPDEVRFDKLHITWRFEYRSPEEETWSSGGEDRTEHETYITYGQASEAFAPHFRPWTQVLRRACFYAHGADTIIEASTRGATGIYDSREFYYTGGTHSRLNNDWINLWQMFNDGWVDCRDISNYYTIMMHWLGITTVWQQKITEVTGGFHFNTLRPLSTALDPDFDEGWWVRKQGETISNWWAFHQVGILNDKPIPAIEDDRTKIYDPMIRIERDTETERVPTDMTQTAYKRAIFDEGKFIWGSIDLVDAVY